MNTRTYFCFVLLLQTLLAVAWGSPTAFPKENSKVTWVVLQDALERGESLKTKKCVGKSVMFDATVIDPFVDKVHWLRPNPLRCKIYREIRSPPSSVDTGIICRITLLPAEIKPVAGFGAASIGIRVVGKVLRVDAATKTVEVPSIETTVIRSD